jgi:hypothetical protein
VNPAKDKPLKSNSFLGNSLPRPTPARVLQVIFQQKFARSLYDPFTFLRAKVYYLWLHSCVCLIPFRRNSSREPKGMNEGWIYVLVNSSVPGLAKVGRTFRPPADRAAELSSATGVATPFVLAFDQPFHDCVAAEAEIHAELDRRGLRAAPNREFFRGATGDIVRVILQAAGTAPPSPARRASAERLLAEAEQHLFGLGDTLQDLAEAERLYRLAAARGSLIALERLGAIYAETDLSRTGRRRAMRALKNGAANGNYYCYCEMARLFARDGEIQNFAKAWYLFFARRAAGALPEVETGEARYITALRSYIQLCLEIGIVPQHLPELRDAAVALMDNLVDWLARPRCTPEERRRFAAVLRWSYQNLVPPSHKHLMARGPRTWLPGWIVAPRRVAARLTA